MFLKEIFNEINTHMKKHNISKENAAINMPLNKRGGKLINLTQRENLRYLLLSSCGRTDYSYFEPIVEVDKGIKVCTYVVYE